MRRLRYILIALFLLSYRGLSAQEFDLYDFRYYKRFETVEELLAPEKDSLVLSKFVLNKEFSTHAFDYNLSMVRFARRGVPYYQHRTTLNSLEIPQLGGVSIRALQIDATQLANVTKLRIDTLREARTSAGVSFSSRNMPYSIQFSTAHKLGDGWSMAANLTAKTGKDICVDGVFGNSLEINAVASKLFKSGNILSMALFMKPSMRGGHLSSTAEAFRLTGNRLYNPAWGYQSGRVRNSRIYREFLPTAFVGYSHRIDERTQLDIAVTATIGVSRYSSLDWFNAQTPSPDNYRYMPSYFVDDDDIFSAVESAWLANNPRYTQIDFDSLIATNRLNGGEAVYAISDRVKRIATTSFRGGATTNMERGSISYGLEVAISNCRNYKQMRDLLGADYIVDLDYFLIDDDTYGNSLQNNLNSPNRHITEMDRFGYDYALRRYNILAFASYSYKTERLDVDIAAKVGYTDISRRGFYRKELFVDNSFGVSRHLKFSPYSLRADVGYLISDNHFIRADITTSATPCEEENLFLQSQYNNRVVDNPTMRTNYDAEFCYMFQRERFTVSATLFASLDLNNTEVQHLYDDWSGEYADIVSDNMDYLRYGLEVEAEYRFATNFRATVALSMGRYKYADNARVTIYTDTSNILLADRVESYTKGLSLGNMPQIAGTIGLSYYNKGWWATVNANYATLRYVEPSLAMRTERVLSMAKSPEARTLLTVQERLNDAFTIDISLSKSIYLSSLNKKIIYSTMAAPRFEDKHPRSRLIFRVGVRNLLGSSDIVYNAYEASRLQRYKLANDYIYNRQATRYRYAYPRTFYASATFSF